MKKRNLITEINRRFPSVSKALTEDDSNQFEAFANTLGTFARRQRNVPKITWGIFYELPEESISSAISDTSFLE